jgi:hypothetical protein
MVIVAELCLCTGIDPFAVIQLQGILSYSMPTSCCHKLMMLCVDIVLVLFFRMLMIGVTWVVAFHKVCR